MHKSKPSLDQIHEQNRRWQLQRNKVRDHSVSGTRRFLMRLHFVFVYFGSKQKRSRTSGRGQVCIRRNTAGSRPRRYRANSSGSITASDGAIFTINFVILRLAEAVEKLSLLARCHRCPHPALHANHSTADDGSIPDHTGLARSVIHHDKTDLSATAGWLHRYRAMHHLIPGRMV